MKTEASTSPLLDVSQTCSLNGTFTTGRSRLEMCGERSREHSVIAAEDDPSEFPGDRDEAGRGTRQKLGMIGRRGFLRVAPAAIAGSFAVPAVAGQVRGSGSQAKAEALQCAEQIIGLDFTEDEQELMLGGVNRNLERYEELRNLKIPADTDPAFSFHPYLPGQRPTGRATPHAALTISQPATVSRPASLEDLAFLPVTTLARLIEARAVSSTELVRMYLSRLRRYGDTLRCVVTLTSDLALEQAAEADREIRAGRYRGPLHGVPWGAKDLFATKGIRTTWGAKPYENQMIDLDAAVVERLREAGAVLVAKLSMGALARGASGLAARRGRRGTSRGARAARPRAPGRRPRPGSSASRSGLRRGGRSFRRRSPVA